MRPRPPPVAALALSFGLGCAATLSGALPPRALFPAALLLLPILPFLRPGTRRRIDGTLVTAALVGILAGSLRAGVWQEGARADCRLRIPDGWSGEVTGRFVAASRGGAVPFRVEDGIGGFGEGGGGDPGCRGVVRSYPDGEAEVRPGVRVRADGTWRLLPRRAWTTAETAGYLSLESIRVVEDPGKGVGAEGLAGLDERVLETRGRIQERIQRLFGPVAPVAEALVLARKEGLDPELRDRFARAGIAHLLAISGFHVGIVGGILLLLGRMAGAGPRGSPLLAAAGAWGYVLAIGSPDAAARAAILLGLLAVGPLRSRPLAPLGALATAFLGFLLVDPGALGRVGFQLSFAGTGALILGSRRAARTAEARASVGIRRSRAVWTRLTGPGGPGGIPSSGAASRSTGGTGPPGAPGALSRTGSPELRALRGLWAGIGAGVAATLGTLPLVAWHFGQVPLLGIPATLILGPPVALAIPGIFASLALDVVAPPAAEFLAGGVTLLLEAVIRGANFVAGLQGDAGWVSRWHVLMAGGGVVLGWGAAHVVRTGMAGRIRWSVATVGGAAGLLLAPVVGAPGTAGTLEIVAIDVGQGDALAIRSPRGRWILVDTGPRSPTFDAGDRRVLPYLRRAGVRRLEALILTHPDLDHIGGAPAVLRGMEVAGVLDPGRIAAKAPFEDVLVAAEDEGVAWWPAATHPSLELDGIAIRVLHPSVGDEVGPPLEDANDASVVLLLTWGRFRALLTGDAPAAVEEEAVRRISGPVQLLKVGHHGSQTSTSRRFLEALRPEAALISVGFRNRYGHPHPRVVERLVGAGTRLFRTDRDGTVVIRARDDGSWSVRLPDAPERLGGPTAAGEGAVGGGLARPRIDPRAARAYR
ncbi:MAG: ComEC/Rec2 family competence protein [Longimicrobiales bacterium]|nr:ComEC/Rec2 family competence protein [Longimicrobiales bacterium]